MSTDRKRIQGGLAIWMGVSALVTALMYGGVFQSFENASWDWRVRSVAKASSRDTQIKIITIDQTSLEYVSKEMGLAWPWPRSVYGPVLEFLRTGGAKAVAFDLLFTEPSNEVGDDEAFAQKVGATLPVVSAVALQRGAAAESAEAQAVFKERQARNQADILSYLRGGAYQRYSAAALPVIPLLERSAAFGSVTSAADEDQIVRHTQPGAYLNDVPILSLPFALYATVHGAIGADEGLNKKQDRIGAYLIRYFGPAATYDTYSMSAILSAAIRLSEGREAKVSPAEFKDSYVFIGGSAPGLLDLRAVPFHGAYPGVEVNATILDNIIHRAFFQHVPRVVAMGAAFGALLLSTFAGLFFRRGGLVTQALVVLAWVGGCFFAAYLGWWLPMIDVVAGMCAVGIASGVLQYQIEGRQHRFIRNAFRYYLSPEVIERIVEDPSSLRLGGERRELTILFSDIQGFTGISERLSADQLVQFLNRFLSEMSTIILKSGGTLDKYQGDAVIAFWNAPLTVTDHRERAVDAALRCQARLRELAAEFEKSFGINIRMRIGIHTGFVSVGNFGSDQRFNYTMIGDAANVASRLEGVNKVFGTSIIVSESTRRESVATLAWRRLGRVKVVGRNEPIEIYQPLARDTDSKLVGELSLYHDALAHFDGGRLAEARALFERLSSDDPVRAAYLARIERMEAQGGGESVVWNIKEK
jgi:adenylate cyclase